MLTLLRECPGCAREVPLSDTCCIAEPEEIALDFVAEDRPAGYMPLHRSPNLLALREAVSRLRTGEWDQETYAAGVYRVWDRVHPLLDQLEHQAARVTSAWPVEAAQLVADAVEAYAAYYEAIDWMVEEPEAGLRGVHEALVAIDRLEGAVERQRRDHTRAGRAAS